MSNWRPYQVVKEIWKGSDPFYADGESDRWEEAPVWGWLGWWWAAFLIAGFTGWQAGIGYFSAETFEEFKNADQIGLFSDILYIASSVLAVFLVNVISSRQERKYKALGSLAIFGVGAARFAQGPHVGTPTEVDRVSKSVTCWLCSGSGMASPVYKCNKCNGTGTISG